MRKQEKKNLLKVMLLPIKEPKVDKFIGTWQYYPNTLCFISILKKYGYKLAVTSAPSIWRLIEKDRDAMSKMHTAGVYSIPIADDTTGCNTQYIGSTSRRLIDRISEHKHDIERLTNNSYTDYNCTSLVKYFCENPLSKIDWDGVKIISKPMHKRSLKIREAIKIISSTCCNSETPVILPYIWSAFLKNSHPACQVGRQRMDDS